ncbi:MAG: threonine--tRNA ligase [Flavobacteriales bacterium]|jgi:threonyl-tRNA synthetase|uniref:threonine--tRNA ligase n=1 Tax=Blattabacterium sp. (Mastotermes darwiniensis) TaxID=39768 RepID=UPI000231DDC1|nr:threonine--tRNA ligase [Blattabacterium sp. (Mastotermes darwiniensis)]AER40501.1 threonyl-tRNA synthetase [Blattabacterium sp. (Mastotermes darwiniensis) str. MADAR]MDR1804984.1 threonine--tRNA ligase [Flavobacteriales bacterium]
MDHRKIGKKLKFFIFSDRVGTGLPLWLPRGTIFRNNLEKFLTDIQKEYGYEMIVTPHIGHKKLYVRSGHWNKYGKDSFKPIQTPRSKEEFLLKPMNCPHHCEVYRSQEWSYRDLPKRFAEFGTVYRYEQSGELHGLTRVRGFTQDDAHIFCTYDQLVEEFKKVINLVFYVFRRLGFLEYTIRVSLRDTKRIENYIGSEKNWIKAEEAILRAVREEKIEAPIHYGEAAFYGPKLDFLIKDSLGRDWQLGTIQVDYNLPERFDLYYKGKNNEKHRPVMIHRAPFGSLERLIAILIEHTKGNLPFWLVPNQAVILPISDKYIVYAKKILNLMLNCGIRVFIDKRNEKIDKKIRDSEENKIPYMIVVGEKEERNETISLRRHGLGHMGIFSISNGIDTIFKETN